MIHSLVAVYSSFIMVLMAYLCIIPQAYAELVYQSKRGVTLRVADTPPLIKFVTPQPLARSEDESKGGESFKARIHIRPDGYVAHIRLLKASASNANSWVRVEPALRQWQYEVNAETVTDVIIEFPRPAPHNAGDILLETEAYRVTTNPGQQEWCFPRPEGGQANINIIWRASAEDSLLKDPTHRQRFEAEIWPVVEQACNTVIAAVVENYIEGIRLIANDYKEIQATEFLPKGYSERPVNQTLADKSTGTFVYRPGPDHYESLAELRKAHGQQAAVALTPKTSKSKTSLLTADDAFPPLDLTNLAHAREIKAVYLGQFERMPMFDLSKSAIGITKEGMLVHRLLAGYVEAFSNRCPDSLSAKKVFLTETINKKLIDGYGNKVDLGTTEHNTGVFAEPEFADAYITITGSDKFKAFISFFQDGGISMLDEMLKINVEMKDFITRHGCNSAQIKRFANNILAKFKNEQPKHVFDAFNYHCTRQITAILPQARPQNCGCLKQVLSTSLDPNKFWALEDDFTEQNFLSTTVAKVGLKQELEKCF
ncbi:hypothetical protein [Nitrosomonas ureae]|uniref:Uncharacterized protein n=1 Tax=Nitrosomonas ureae TaxID=44577 RepID=A0A1H9FGX5_9PROT|nr:hypothetical protein [Nitrosomonas ureae]SEQ37162.1 hypothetical protein SAMN05421510_104310 [Nitrosomonas ureae]